MKINITIENYSRFHRFFIFFENSRTPVGWRWWKMSWRSWKTRSRAQIIWFKIRFILWKCYFCRISRLFFQIYKFLKIVQILGFGRKNVKIDHWYRKCHDIFHHWVYMWRIFFLIYACFDGRLICFESAYLTTMSKVINRHIWDRANSSLSSR